MGYKYKKNRNFNDLPDIAEIEEYTGGKGIRGSCGVKKPSRENYSKNYSTYGHGESYGSEKNIEKYTASTHGRGGYPISIQDQHTSQQRGMNQQGISQVGVYNQGMQQRGMQQRGMQQRGMQQRGMQQRGMQQRGMQQRSMQQRGMPNPQEICNKEICKDIKIVQGKISKKEFSVLKFVIISRDVHYVVNFIIQM